MIFLGLASLLAMALGLERLIALSKGRVMPEKFIGGLKEAWNNDPSGSEALAFCDESGGTVGHVFKAGIRRVNMGRDAVEKAIDDVGSREADKMKRSLRPLRNIAMVSPLLGLLGTVYGMIDAFQKTSQSGGTASTANAILYDVPVDAKSTTFVNLSAVMATSDTIEGSASVASSVTIHSFGIQEA